MLTALEMLERYSKQAGVPLGRYTPTPAQRHRAAKKSRKINYRKNAA